MSERRVGLVLGAGGVVGHAWHSGVLAAITESTGWDVRLATLVVGTSAGSFIAAMSRGGISAGDLYARTTGGELSDEGLALLAEVGMAQPEPPPRPRSPDDGAVLTLRGYRPASPALLRRVVLTPWRFRLGHLAAGGLPRGQVDNSEIAAAITALHGSDWPEQQMWICALRLSDGHRAVFGRPDSREAEIDVGTAVAASCAIPGWFAPVTIEGLDYVDGGAHSPTNADLVAGEDLDLVIVSSPMSVDRSGTRRLGLDRAFRLANRAVLQRELAAARNGRTSIFTIQPGPPDLAVMGGNADAMDFKRRARVARQARESTMRRLDAPKLASVLEVLTRS